jgi:hypothetical protein
VSALEVQRKRLEEVSDDRVELARKESEAKYQIELAKEVCIILISHTQSSHQV